MLQHSRAAYCQHSRLTCLTLCCWHWTHHCSRQLLVLQQANLLNMQQEEADANACCCLRLRPQSSVQDLAFARRRCLSVTARKYWS